MYSMWVLITDMKDFPVNWKRFASNLSHNGSLRQIFPSCRVDLSSLLPKAAEVDSDLAGLEPSSPEPLTQSLVFTNSQQHPARTQTHSYASAAANSYASAAAVTYAHAASVRTRTWKAYCGCVHLVNCFCGLKLADYIRDRLIYPTLHAFELLEDIFQNFKVILLVCLFGFHQA